VIAITYELGLLPTTPNPLQPIKKNRPIHAAWLESSQRKYFLDQTSLAGGSRHVPRRARRRIQRPARRRGSPSSPSSKPDGEVNQPHRAIRLRPETARRGKSTARETRNTEGKSGQRIRGEIERRWVSGDDSCGQAVMQKARGERSSDVCFFWVRCVAVCPWVGVVTSSSEKRTCRRRQTVAVACTGPWAAGLLRAGSACSI
jgi:hypothetical protein